MLRAILINRMSVPTREALTTTERAVGETILAGLNAEWGGYILMEEAGMCAQWLVHEDFPKTSLQILRTQSATPGYAMRLFNEPDLTEVDLEENEIIDAG